MAGNDGNPRSRSVAFFANENDRCAEQAICEDVKWRAAMPDDFAAFRSRISVISRHERRFSARNRSRIAGGE